MRPSLLPWIILASAGLVTTPLLSQEPSLLRNLPAVEVLVDWVHVPMTEPMAESLRSRVITELRKAGMLVLDTKSPVTMGSFLSAPTYGFDKPTFLVSLNMVPDGCAFVSNFYLRMPVAVSGYGTKVPLSVYASRSYIYSTALSDHSPVLNFLEDFVGAWRDANPR